MTIVFHLFFHFFLTLFCVHRADCRPNCENISLTENQIFLVNDKDQRKKVMVDFGLGERRRSPGNDEQIDMSNAIFSDKISFAKSREFQICDTTAEPIGRIGYDIFRKSQNVFHLDFDASTICLVSNDQIREILKGGYREIDSRFQRDGLYIAVTMNRKIYYLKFDTGMTGTISMQRRDAESFSTGPHRTYLSIDGEFKIYPNRWITVSENTYNTTITVGTGESAIGMGVLKGFNWVIDFRTRKVYIKKNMLGLDAENDFPSDYQTTLRKGQLILMAVNSHVSKLRPGDKIVGFRGTVVTDENRCEISASITNGEKIRDADFNAVRSD